MAHITEQLTGWLPIGWTSKVDGTIHWKAEDDGFQFGHLTFTTAAYEEEARTGTVAIIRNPACDLLVADDGYGRMDEMMEQPQAADEIPYYRWIAATGYIVAVKDGWPRVSVGLRRVGQYVYDDTIPTPGED